MANVTDPRGDYYTREGSYPAEYAGENISGACDICGRLPRKKDYRARTGSSGALHPQRGLKVCSACLDETDPRDKA
jgi:hypothetical protein